MYKKLEHLNNRHNNLERKWEHGTWLGVIPTTGEIIVGVGIAKCRSVVRRPEADGLSAHGIQSSGYTNEAGTRICDDENTGED